MTPDPGNVEKGVRELMAYINPSHSDSKLLVTWGVFQGLHMGSSNTANLLLSRCSDGPQVSCSGVSHVLFCIKIAR